MPAPPTRPALRARYDRRRQEVVDVAAQLFAQRGYHGTSIEDLIAATGLTRGGLYHYTDSKQGLLFGVLDELMDPLLEQARGIVGEPGRPEEHLRLVARAWLAHVAAHLDHMVVFERERATLEADPRWEQVRRARREFEHLLAGVLERGRADGSFAIDDPQLVLLALLGMVNHTANWLRPAGRLRPEQVADSFCDVLLDGVRAR
ncbi:MAG TPA: TetR/AcrR family transcriptional regulator [Conexibacter sp.]|nr:TetR/AcrR family transcriptional regulator [Conexibacter sp.]